MRVPPRDLDLEWTLNHNLKYLESYNLIRGTVILLLYSVKPRINDHHSWLQLRLYKPLILSFSAVQLYDIAILVLQQNLTHRHSVGMLLVDANWIWEEKASYSFNSFLSFRTDIVREYTPLAKRQESHGGKLVVSSVCLILFAPCGVSLTTWSE